MIMICNPIGIQITFGKDIGMVSLIKVSLLV